MRRREREKLAAEKRKSQIQSGSSTTLGESAPADADGEADAAGEGQGLSKSAKRRRRQSQIKKATSTAESEALAESIAQIVGDGKQTPDAATISAQKEATQSNLKLSPRSEAAQSWQPKSKQSNAKAQQQQQNAAAAAAMKEAQQLGGMINLSSIPSHSRTNSEMGDQSVRVSVPFNTPAGVPDTHKEIARALSELVNKQQGQAQAAAAAGGSPPRFGAMSTPNSKSDSDKKKTISNYTEEGSASKSKTSTSKAAGSTPAGTQAMASTPTTAASSQKGASPMERARVSERSDSATIAVKSDMPPQKKTGFFEKLCFCLAGKKTPVA